jgi:two-component system, NarL family, sensor histidine kinase BarA
MGKRAFSLKTIYIVALTVAFAVSFFAFAAFDFYSQQKQTEQAMLEEARTFAREMDAVWQFMDNQQNVINTSSDGTYEFKGLHCSVVGKSVGRLFSAGSDYAIRYTNFNPRSEQDIPDDFETKALDAFYADRSVKEYYGVASFDGEDRFRYLQALEVDNSCLECHGEPAGEIDITGHAKEGWTLESVGGAISIVIPLDQQQAAMRDNVIRDVAYFLMITVFIGAIIYVVTTVFVLRPLGGMHRAFGELREGRLEASLSEQYAAKEVQRLMAGFNDMAGELRDMYEHLESQVEARTIDLSEANALLEHQRDKLEQLNADLAQETQFKSDLLSMVNHELRTPLTSIITFAQISREACAPSNAADRRSWEEIEKNSQILLNMINNMLDIARSDAGSVRATCEPMDLGDVVASVKSTMAPLARKYEVSFRTKVAPNVPLVNGDYEKTTRMLENLASNAIKFTPDGGSIELRVAVDEATHVVTLSMADDGIGIAPEDQERIFERFVQVDSTSTRKYNGSGLGLALVREYGEMQGFAVTVESELGVGSTFVITIPADAIVGEDDV